MTKCRDSSFRMAITGKMVSGCMQTPTTTIRERAGAVVCDVIAIGVVKGSPAIGLLVVVFDGDAHDTVLDRHTVDAAGGRNVNGNIDGVVELGVGRVRDVQDVDGLICATLLKIAKKALLRPIGHTHDNPAIAMIENELISQLNASGIGPMGLGGKTTVLDVKIEVAHRHPASLPVGLVVQCWANRRARLLLHADGTWEVQ